MDIGCQAWLEKIRPKMPYFLGRIIDIGALDINGSAKEYLRTVDYAEYIGIDMQDGKGVDIKMNAHDIKDRFTEGEFDLVICMNTLEHDNKFWVTLENIRYILKPGGSFIFASPTTNFPEHKHPQDFYRFMPDAVKEVVFEGFDVIDIETVYSKKIEDSTHRKGWRGINPIICGLGIKI